MNCSSYACDYKCPITELVYRMIRSWWQRPGLLQIAVRNFHALSASRWFPHRCSEGCQCIVVVRWTVHLPLGLPYAISLQCQSKPLVTTVSPATRVTTLWFLFSHCILMRHGSTYSVWVIPVVSYVSRNRLTRHKHELFSYGHTSVLELVVVDLATCHHHCFNPPRRLITPSTVELHCVDTL